MDKIINVEILGHPLNWISLIVLIVLAWYAAFAFHTCKPTE